MNDANRDLARHIKELYASCTESEKTALSGVGYREMREVNGLLLQARKEVANDDWQSWLAETGINYDTAKIYILMEWVDTVEDDDIAQLVQKLHKSWRAIPGELRTKLESFRNTRLEMLCAILHSVRSEH